MALGANYALIIQTIVKSDRSRPENDLMLLINNASIWESVDSSPVKMFQ